MRTCVRKCNIFHARHSSEHHCFSGFLFICEGAKNQLSGNGCTRQPTFGFLGLVETLQCPVSLATFDWSLFGLGWHCKTAQMSPSLWQHQIASSPRMGREIQSPFLWLHGLCCEATRANHFLGGSQNTSTPSFGNIWLPPFGSWVGLADNSMSRLSGDI